MFFWRQEIYPGRWAAFSNAEAGNLALHVGDEPASVLRRRAQLESAMHVPAGSLRFMHQTHSADAVAVGSGDDRAAVVTADALISDDGSVPLAVMVADCVPVVLSARGGAGATAVVHAGRQGILDGIITSTVAELRRLGTEDLGAWIGPSICGGCYEVPADMRDDVAAVVPAAWATTRWGTPGLDLPAAVTSQLQQMGVQVHPVGDPAQLCTLDNESLFSHRRSAAAGRFVGLVWNQ
ncbi:MULTISPECIES: polyphenol oxidase family protein [unclassified Arthrobacter]|uniref:polyphenol oxidase family protein n=1 Tax=unclassified Arthrobacter TaxID=235627 RepID=UPI00149280EA|nr:polyphenol oxidase family protein [Arthrobacter sp. AET 35A]MBE0009862.1 laccase domain-containing protein [Arthrobacter sp. AET 35A]NOJ63798.1 laccase domain-containing protein [Arthrobacter sp. 147(2020)]